MSIYKSKEIRRRETLYKINLNVSKYEIDYTYDFNDVKLKSINEICKRYISNLLSIQIAIDFINGVEEIDKSIAFFNNLVDIYDVRESSFRIENKAFNKEINESECFYLSFQCECLGVLAWVLGLKDIIEKPNKFSNINEMMKLVAICDNFDSFLGKCSLRSIDEILDEFDLYYTYHRICVSGRINYSYNYSSLNENIILERRRAFEWLFSNINDWNDLSLYT